MLDSLSICCVEIDLGLWCILVVSANQITAVHERNPLGSPTETADFFFLPLPFFSEPHIHRSVKNGKKKNMVACLTGPLCSLAPLYILLFFEQKGISFLPLSFFCLPLLPFLFLLRLFVYAHRPLLLPRQRVWNVSYRTQSARVFSSEWLLLPRSVCAFAPDNGVWQMVIPQKPPQNDMTDFPPHFTATNCDAGALSPLALWVARSVLWSQQTFFCSNPVSALCFAPPSLRPVLIPRPRARAEGGEVIVASECIELYGNPAEEKGTRCSYDSNETWRKQAWPLQPVGCRHSSSQNTRWLQGWGEGGEGEGEGERTALCWERRNTAGESED